MSSLSKPQKTNLVPNLKNSKKFGLIDFPYQVKADMDDLDSSQTAQNTHANEFIQSPNTFDSSDSSHIASDSDTESPTTITPSQSEDGSTTPLEPQHIRAFPIWTKLGVGVLTLVSLSSSSASSSTAESSNTLTSPSFTFIGTFTAGPAVSGHGLHV